MRLAGLWSKKKAILLSGLLLILSGTLAACTGMDTNGQTVTEQEIEQDTGETGMEAEGRYSYHTEEIWCENSGNRIYGIAYIPTTEEEKKPLVIFSHELGNSHTAGIPYAERLVQAGYAAYTFDFCGGTVGVGNKSDGNNTTMSIMTEASDLEAVLDTAMTWDFVDPERIFLLGGSQGGAVTVLAGTRNAEKIGGMMLMYPALSAVENVHAQFPSIESVPEEYDMFGGWIRVGRNYATDIWNEDFYEDLAGYQGEVLLLHGDRDSTIDISYSERAAEVTPHCEYHVISGGGHEFFHAQLEEAITHILTWLRENASSQSVSAQETSSDAGDSEQSELQMMIGDTPVTVAWEDNESVSALKELASAGPLVIQMSMYSSFEQVGSLGTSLPRNDVQTTTKAGDIVLYAGNQLVVFYGANSWAYTRFGHITDKTAQEMAELLGSGDVTITLQMG